MNENTNSHPASSQRTIEVTLIRDGIESRIQWSQDLTLLHALLQAGIDAPYSCERGNCGTCVCKLEEGNVDLRRNFVLSETHIQQGLILPCVSRPGGPKVRINYDQF